MDSQIEKTCQFCGKELENHRYDDGNFGISAEKPCSICGKLLKDHPLRCGHCGRIFCGNHVFPQMHNCTQNLIPLRSPALKPARITGILHGLAILAGIGVLILGIYVYLGNTTGTHPTFPFAGYITMSIGFVLVAYGAGAKL